MIRKKINGGHDLKRVGEVEKGNFRDLKEIKKNLATISPLMKKKEKGHCMSEAQKKKKHTPTTQTNPKRKQ